MADKLQKTIQRLRTLERDWPAGYMLFASGSGGNLILCKGQPQDGGQQVEVFQIPADGSGPDWTDNEQDSARQKRLVKFRPPSSTAVHAGPRPDFTGKKKEQSQ